MQNSRTSKFFLIADIIICTLLFFLITHNGLRWWRPSPLMLSFPLLRIWLSFLIYRKSKTAMVPIVIMTLMASMAIFNVLHSNSFTYDLFVKPWISLFLKTTALFDAQIIRAHELQEVICNIYNHTPIFSLIGYIWLIGAPLAVYVYRMRKNMLQPTELSLRKNIGLHMYLFFTIFAVMIAIPLTGYTAIGLLVLAVLLVHIPAIFYNGDWKGLFTRNEVAFILTFAILAICYMCALELEERTVVAVCALPISFYATVNWYARRKPTYKDFVLMLVASAIFWCAQYTTNMMRILLLLASLALMAIPVVRFFNATGRKFTSAVLFIMIALIIPMLSVGYNPYAGLEARRLRHYENYLWAKDGLLMVKSKDGLGLRDRYKIILPAEYDYFDILTPSKPYCKVAKDGLYGIYDIERKEFVSDERFTDVVPYEKNIYRLKTEKGDKYLIMPLYYNRYRIKQPAVISEKLPQEKKQIDKR